MFTTSSVISQLQESKAANYTEEQLLEFYKIITQGASDPKEPRKDLLKMMEKNFFEFVQWVLRDKKIDNTFETKTRMLADQIEMLIKGSFFSGKISDEVVKQIQTDIKKQGGNLKKIIVVDDVSDFIGTLSAIRSQNSEVFTQNTCPTKFNTGLSRAEGMGLTYSTIYQTSTVAYGLNERGLQYLEQGEWQAAINLFREAISAEEEMSAEVKKDKNDNNIAIFQKNISIAYSGWSFECEMKEEYSLAIEKCRTVIQILNNIPVGLRAKSDKEALISHQRKLCFLINLIGMDAFNKKLYSAAIMKFREVLDEFAKMDSAFLSDKDEEDRVIFMNNLAYAEWNLAVNEYNQNHFDNAILHQQSAIDEFQKISQFQPIESTTLTICYRNLAIDYNARGMEFKNQDQLLAAKNNFELAMKAINQIEERNLTNQDIEARQIYQNNLNWTLSQIELAKPLTLNPFALFQADTNGGQSDQDCHRPSKRQRTI